MFYESSRLHYRLDDDFWLYGKTNVWTDVMYEWTDSDKYNHNHNYYIVYQPTVQLLYVDKLLEQVYLAFQDCYKDDLKKGSLAPSVYTNFGDVVGVQMVPPDNLD